LLIINADDFGVCHAVNEAIFRSLTEGVVGSTTVMVPCPWAAHAMRLLAENPAIPFGVHLTAFGDTVHYRWGPLTCRDKAPTLVDETGYFYVWERMDEFLAQVRLDELEVEFRAQIETVLAAGLKPTHLDWHSLRIARKPEIFDVLFRLAREHGLAARVRERPSIENVQRQRLPCNDFDFLDSFDLPIVDKPAHYIGLLRELPEGLSEWAVHPSLGDAEAQAIDPVTWQVRRTDYDFLMSAEAREVIEQEGIVLLSYAPLQQVWQGKAT
jgi:predicted glycoside hydrolase/deacetylase ChbG (UPF0249 family)